MSSRPVFACSASALTLTANAIFLGCHHHGILAGLCGYVAFVFVLLAAGRVHHDRMVRAQHEQARRAAAVDEQLLDAPSPCCQFWKHSTGRAHGPDCTRPPLVRRDRYRLDPVSAEAFAEITAHFDDREAA